MMISKSVRTVLPLVALAAAGFALNVTAKEAPALQPDPAAKPLKVYILAGQSNMEGHAKIETFDYIGSDPVTAPLLKQMRGPDGKPRICENVWISYFTGWKTSGEGYGKLTAGYGARSDPAQNSGKIGPEFTFGLTMEKSTDGPILIIKTAWGGKSLNTDFRPPSAGPYKLNSVQMKHYKQRGLDIEKWKKDKAEKTGVYYRLMMEHVRKVLADPKRICPAYDPKQGYELAGFVWFQGWNDMCDGDTYPNRNKPGGYAEYSSLMAHFIRDVRKDLAAPKMPFVIGVIGVDGDKAKGAIANLRPAMAAPAQMPEFNGNVAAVETAPYWDHEMAALQSKKGMADHRLQAAHVITEDGVMEKRETEMPGWEPIGTPEPRDRTWRFISIDPQNKEDQLPKNEKKRFRGIALPDELHQWYMPDFDDSEWNSGKGPIGTGSWKHRIIGDATVKYNSDWGNGEFLLMRTTFTVDNLDYQAFRISVLARQGFHIYLNGHKIHTYIWWKDEPFYRAIPLEPQHVKYLKKGKNILAVYANAEYDRRTQALFASTDLWIEGITRAGMKYVKTQAYIDRQMRKVCTPREQKIIMGSSNAGYHYLGSAKIMAQIGKAFARAILEMGNLAGNASAFTASWVSLDSRPVPEWWLDAKFGIFIHWGVYSVPAWCDGWYAEWYYRLIQDGSGGSPTMRAHHKRTYGADFKYPRFASKFKAENYNPKAWARLFRNAGARYVVLTSKHHDGFCLWDSPDSERWNAVDVGPKQDLIAPLAQAVRDESMKFGLYISMMEWDHGDNLPGNRYPKNSDEYVEKHLMPQMKDLVKRYQPSIMWPDGEWDKPSSYWRSEEFLSWYANNAANKDQVVWNDRWGKDTRGKHGGFYTTEYGKHGKEGGAHPWEENRGIGRSYGYNSWYEDRDGRYPSTQQLLDVFVNVLSRGGNFLLNVGPKADGAFIDVFENRLLDIGRFLKVNGEAVYGSRLPYISDQGDNIKFTRDKQNQHVYAFVKNKPGSSLTLKGVYARKNAKIVLLADPKKTALSWSNQGDDLVIEDIDRVSQHGEFYWVFKIPGGFNSDPDASRGAVGPDLYAYYTRLDYRIPLSEINMDVPFSNEEHIRAYWKARAARAIPSDVPRPKNPIVKIGAASPNFGGMFEGNVDHISIYDRKLSKDDISRMAAGNAVDTALVANYRFNRSMADSAGGRPAIRHEGAEFSSHSSEGSHSLRLDGRRMWVELPVETPGDQGFTWSAWIRTSGEGTVISHCNRSGPWHAQGRCLFVRDGNLTFDIGWVGAVEHPADISDGRWHHVAVAGGTKLSEVDLYVDGKCSPGAPPITGKYADIVVHIDEDRSLVFSREASYCPWLETPAGRFPFKQLVACRPDPMCLSSYVRIIKNEPEEVLIHWCHVPDPESIVITEKIHELFAVTPGGMVVRRVKVGTRSLEDFEDPANQMVQKLQLTEAGFRELSLSKPELSGTPGKAVDGSPVRKSISVSPAAWLKFDEGLRARTAAEKQQTEESVGGTVCTISGNKALWKRGVSGTALAFDGYFSRVTLPERTTPRLTDELTLEAWVVLGAYPWNDAGIVHQSAGEAITAEAYKHGYTDPYVYRPWKMEGYLLGIDPYGRPMFKVGGRQVGSGEVRYKETVSPEQVIPTYRWVHLAGVYGHGRMSLYMDGKLIEERPASGVIEVPDRDVLVGLNGDAQRVSDPVSHSDFAANNNLPIVYGIEGLIDEVKIYDRALSDEQIQQSYRAFLPRAEDVSNPCLERRILPGEVTGRPAGKFGAAYTTLEYHELWDNLWRPSSYRDIIVRFDALPTSVVFWQGPNFGSGWVTENNRWMSDQSAEIGGPHGCAEHMADKRGRFGHVRLIENTDARVVVHWRYPSIDVGYVFPSPDVWADEYYTIYPDGAGIRYVARAKGGWHDTQFLTQAGTTCLDNLSLTALSVANMDGESAELTWEPPNRVPRNPIKDACIKVINFKSNWKVYAIYRQGAEIQQWGRSEQSKHTRDPFAGPWNHWPVGLNPSDGRYAVSHDRVTHAAVGGARGVGPFIMYGFTDQAVTSLIPLAKSWNRPAKLGSLNRCESSGYSQTERAYRLTAKASSVSFALDGSEETPIHNPCFVIERWTSKNKSRLVVNGRELAPGKSFRQGITRDTDGTRTLVLWLQLRSTSPVRFTVKAAEG